MNKQGLLLCAQYSVAPNYFGYCGPDENISLVDHLKEKVGDTEVRSILTEFETLYLYLTLIARENKMDDVFEQHVVEAYWLGNNLLQHVSNRDYSYLLDEKLDMEKKLGVASLSQLSHKIRRSRIYPHHSFHVFNIFKRTGHDPSFHTIRTMDECRIGWGKVITQTLNHTNDKIVQVLTRPLIMIKNKLTFGTKTVKDIELNYKGKQFIKPEAGDFVSFHWGHICDVINPAQIKNLQFYTQKAVDFFNSP